MTQPGPWVTYVLPDKLGGVFNYVENLLAHRAPDGLGYRAVLTACAQDRDTRSAEPLPADDQAHVCYDASENLHAVLRRLARHIPRGPGVLVANDWLALAMASVNDRGCLIVSVVHGDFDYYYDLSVRHESIIDRFVTYTDRTRDRLVELIPHRADAVVHLPYGVRIADQPRRAAAGPLRLLYVGRLDRQKGVFDLPGIDARLRELGVEARWTIQGAGPDEDRLRASWPEPRVTWRGRQPMERVLASYADHDVLVLPCRAEGLPVALLEGAVAGLVPVVSDLSSGIPEVVEEGRTGYRVSPGDVAGFASAIEELDRNRERLEQMSRAIRAHASARFDARRRTADYQALYRTLLSSGRRSHRRGRLQYGSRLDKPWIPNPLVRALRKAMRASAGVFGEAAERAA